MGSLLTYIPKQNRFLHGQLEAERDANRENRRIIAALTSRIPELPAASSESPTESPETATVEEAEPRAARLQGALRRRQSAYHGGGGCSVGNGSDW